MKLVVFGLAVSSTWGNGHAMHWRGILRSLAQLGHDVVFFERDTPYHAEHRDLPKGEGYEIAIYPSWEAILPRARAAVASADVAIVTSYQADAAAAIELVLGASGVRVFYDLDAPVTLDLLMRGVRVPYLPEGGVGGFDLVLSSAGGRTLDLLRDLGARSVAPLYASVDEVTHRPSPVEASPDFECDLSYLGAYSVDRQATVDRLLLDVAAQLPQQRFLLGGAMYPPQMKWPPNLRWFPQVAAPDQHAFYGSSRMTLNVTRASMAALGHCPSARLFEAAVCGVPIVMNDWSGLEEFFEPGREVVVARECHDVEAALSLPSSELTAMAQRARERTLAEHTARHRARELLDLTKS